MDSASASALHCTVRAGGRADRQGDLLYLLVARRRLKQAGLDKGGRVGIGGTDERGRDGAAEAKQAACYSTRTYYEYSAV